MPITPSNMLKHLAFWIALTLAPAWLPAATAWAAAAPADLQQRINKLDARINAILASIKKNRVVVHQISAFSGTARAWFVKLDEKDARIRAKNAERKAVASENYTNTINRIEAEKRQLEKERAGITVFNGEPVFSYSGIQCTTMDQLRSEFHKAAQLNLDLQLNNAALEKNLKDCIDQREQLLQQTGQTGSGSAAQLAGYRSELSHLQEEQRFFQELSEDPNHWFITNEKVMAHTANPVVFSRDMAIQMTTEAYLKETVADGTRFEPAVLASRIKDMRDRSEQVRLFITSRKLPDLQAQIRKLEYKIKGLQEGGDILGCWMLTINGQTSTFRVSPYASGGYIGVVEIDHLRYYSQGETAFIVKPTAELNQFQAEASQ